MKHGFLFLLLGMIVACAGCQTQQITMAEDEVVTEETVAPMPPISRDLQRVVWDIPTGMSEDDLDRHMKIITTDTGTMFFGHAQSKRKYYRIGEDHQVWVDLTTYDLPTVIGVGPIEAYRPWNKFDGGVISVQ